MTYSPPSHVAILNKSSTLGDDELALWVEAYRQEIIRVADAWQLPPPGLAIYPRGHTEEPDPAVAAIYVVDTAGDPDALGYHTATGRSRYGYVDMRLSTLYDVPSVVFGHELYELFLDADVDRWVGPLADGTHVALEICDPVQRNHYPVQASFMGANRTVDCSDYILPSWFDPNGQRPFCRCDGLGPVRPFQDAPGGYHVTEALGVVITSTSARVKNFGRTFRRLTARRRDEAQAA